MDLTEGGKYVVGDAVNGTVEIDSSGVSSAS